MAYPTWSGVYPIVRAHEKPGFGFWVPERILTEDEIERERDWLRQLEGPYATWDRCKYLAQAAHGTAGPDLRAALLREAFANADAQQEPNRIVSAASWPLRALLDLGETKWFARELECLLPIIEAEPNPFRRQDGLYALLFVDAPPPWFDRVFDLYCAACDGPQKTLTMRRVAQYVNRVDHARACAVAWLIREPRRRRQALREIGETAADGAMPPA